MTRDEFRLLLADMVTGRVSAMAVMDAYYATDSDVSRLTAELAQARAELAHFESGEEYERTKRVAERDGLQALAQYARAQKAEDANAKLRADVIEMREALGALINSLEIAFTGIELRERVPEIKQARAALEVK